MKIGNNDRGVADATRASWTGSAHQGVIMSRQPVPMPLRPTRAGIGLCILSLVPFILVGASAVRAASGNNGQPDITVGVLAK